MYVYRAHETQGESEVRYVVNKYKVRSPFQYPSGDSLVVDYTIAYTTNFRIFGGQKGRVADLEPTPVALTSFHRVCSLPEGLERSP